MTTVATVTGTGLRRLTCQDLDQAGRLLARSFRSDPAVAFIFADELHRDQVLPDLWRGAASYTLLYGEAWTTPALTGVACWLPPGLTHKTLPRMLRAGMGSLFFELSRNELRRNLTNDRYSDRLHERYAPGPHWYLFVIGVEPMNQSQGIGSALLKPMLAQADTEQVPIYLETHNPRNVEFYEKNGFCVAGEGRVPGSSVAMFPMLRPPRQPNS